MSKMSTSIIVVGAGGRMGARVCALAMREPLMTLRGAVEHAASPLLGAPSSPAGPQITAENAAFDAPAPCVVIDFSSAAGSAAAAALAQRLGASLVVGTTGLSEATLAMLRALSEKIPVLVCPNTSLGVAVTADLARRAAAALGPGYEVSIVESHHSAKKDAPSGTALRLAAAVGETGRPVKPEQIVSIRGGDVIGEHTVRFAGAGEYIELTHRATSRDLFALGALRAAAWISGRASGWYTIEDVLRP